MFKFYVPASNSFSQSGARSTVNTFAVATVTSLLISRRFPAGTIPDTWTDVGDRLFRGQSKFTVLVQQDSQAHRQQLRTASEPQRSVCKCSGETDLPVGAKHRALWNKASLFAYLTDCSYIRKPSLSQSLQNQVWPLILMAASAGSDLNPVRQTRQGRTR